MKYNLEISDQNNWINTIYEEKNTKDILVLNIDFQPKYLGTMLSTGDKNLELMFYKDENTLRAEGVDKPGTVEINFEEDFHFLSFSYGGRYSHTICVVRDNMRGLLVYSKPYVEE